MFLTRFVNAIGEDWEEIEEELDKPPKHGRYTAFDDYPTADYLRLLDRAARNRFPRQSTREAYRHHSYVSEVATGVIAGFGAHGYELAVQAALNRIRERG